jgi:lipoprotein signal peptidase
MFVIFILFADLFIKNVLPLNYYKPLFSISYLNISVSIKKTYNTKLGLSLGPSVPYWQLALFQTTCMIYLCMFAYHHYDTILYSTIASIMIAGTSNIADRLYNKAITDYILIKSGGYNINVNLADLVITINIVIFYMYSIYICF